MNFNQSHTLHECDERVQSIEKRLKEALHPSLLKIRDDSRLHAGHESAKASGGGHFSVLIVSEAFQGKNRVERHQMVYRALTGSVGYEIHAIQIQAKTSVEHEEEQG